MKSLRFRLLTTFMSLCLAAGAAVSATAATSYAAQNAETSNIAATAIASPDPDEDPSSAPEPQKNGWREENGSRYYYKDGKALTGLQRIDGKTYYFGTDGAAKTGWQTVNGKTCYFESDGKRYEKTGFQTISGKKYYFNSDHAIEKNWLTIGKKKYYLGSNGAMRTGQQTIGGSVYYFSASGVMQTGFLNSNGSRYYFSSSGKRYEKTGFQTINKKKYYFNSNHTVQTKAKKIGGKNYTFDKNGVMQTGFVTISGKTYYYTSSGARCEKTGFQTVSKKKYYFNADHSIQKNWKTIGKKKYYFGSNGVMRTGLQTISKKTYYFDSKGVMQKSKWIKVKGKRYYLCSNGRAATGWKKISGYRYWFSSTGVLDEDVRSRSDVKGPYRLIISLKECTVLVLARGSNGVYDIPAAKFVCSPGKPSTPTPTGTFYARKTTRWQALMGPSWGQYGVHVVGGIFFHSIPCGSANIYNIPHYDYYTLGKKASHGCIRLLVRDEKWIYDHAGGNGIRTTITNSNAKSVISYLQKPDVPPLAPGQTWDPTDPIAIREQGAAKATTKPAAGETLQSYQITSDVNLRSGPGTGYQSLETLPKGLKLQVVSGYSKKANGYQWLKIKIGTKYYYAVSRYLKKTSDPAVTGKKTVQISLVSYKTTAAASYRSGPGTGYSKKGTLAKGAKIQVVSGYSKKANGCTWYKFKSGSQYYYIPSKYVKKVTTSAAKEKLVNYKTTDSLNLRSGPGTGYAIKGTLAKGAKIQIVSGYSKKANNYTWYKMKSGSKYYYVASNYVKKI